MNIQSNSGYPSSALSNFAPHKFVFRGIECASMEGLLQSLKFKSPEMQIEVCKLVGKVAKNKGCNKNWRQTQTLYWQGKPILRSSDEYQELLDEAYECLGKNEGFKKALLSTNNAVLTHSIGKSKRNETILTVNEFCGRLTKLRTRLKNEQILKWKIL